MKALSIRQPWAHMILHGKDIENRTWPTNFRGRFLIHAGKQMTCAEYNSAIDFMVMEDRIAIDAPIPPDFNSPLLLRGGIIGEAEIVDCVTHSNSPWFMGGYGFVLANVKPLPFHPCKGALGFFNVDYPVTP